MNSVVVIEDDQSLREMLSSILSANGYDVVAFTDGESAVVDHQSFGADLAIIDVGLPGMDGLDVCRRLRSHGRTAPVMILTARHDVRGCVLALDAGADGYLVKPFALDELLARVRALMRRRGTDGGTVALFDRVARSTVELRGARSAATTTFSAPTGCRRPWRRRGRGRPERARPRGP